MANEINQQEFETRVLQEKLPVILDFYSTECPPCEALAPKFEALHELYKDKIKFYKIFRQGNKELALKLGVYSSPTLLFFKDGKEVGNRLSGAIKKSEIKSTIVNAFNLEDRKSSAPRTVLNYDLAIIGGGPAGLTAAIYASIAKLKTIVIDQGNAGGQVNLTHQVINYPGFEKPVNGFMLMHHFYQQAKENGAEFLPGSEITGLNLKDKIIDIDDDKQVRAKSVILATGARPRSLGIPGELELFGKGLSFCATCDGKFYEGKKVYVIGGGNSAVEESIFLLQFVKELVVIHQFDELQANKKAADELLSKPNVKVLWSHEPREFIGKTKVDKIVLENLKTKQKVEITDADGVFIFVGYKPQNELFKDLLKLNQWGYIETKEDLQTEISGVYAAGDLRAKQYKQITTAVSDGTVAALNAEKYIRAV